MPPPLRFLLRSPSCCGFLIPPQSPAHSVLCDHKRKAHPKNPPHPPSPTSPFPPPCPQRGRVVAGRPFSKQTVAALASAFSVTDWPVGRRGTPIPLSHNFLVRRRVLGALLRPCRVLYSGATRDGTTTEPRLSAYPCVGPLLLSLRPRVVVDVREARMRHPSVVHR